MHARERLQALKRLLQGRPARGAVAANREFAKVVAIYEPIEKLLMPAERRRLEVARERVRTGRRDGW